MRKNEVSNQIGMEEIMGLGEAPDKNLIKIRDVLIDTFFGPNSNLSPAAMRVAAAYFSRIHDDVTYVILDKGELVQLLGDERLNNFNSVVDEFKRCYIKVTGEDSCHTVSAEVAAFQFGYRRNKEDQRLKEFVLACNQLPEVKKLFVNVTEDHFFTGAFRLYLELSGNSRNTSRTMRFYWYLKRNVIQRAWSVSEQRLRMELGCVNSNSSLDNFVRQVIKPVVEYINNYSDLSVSITSDKVGAEHKIVGFKIECREIKPVLEDNLLGMDNKDRSDEEKALFARIRVILLQDEGSDDKIWEIVDAYPAWKKYWRYSDDKALDEIVKLRKKAIKKATYINGRAGYVLSIMKNSQRGYPGQRKTGRESGITVEPSEEKPTENTEQNNPKLQVQDSILVMYQQDDDD